MIIGLQDKTRQNDGEVIQTRTADRWNICMIYQSLKIPDFNVFDLGSLF